MSSGDDAEVGGLGFEPTPDDGARLGESMPWDESMRPSGPTPPAEREYSAAGKAAGKHLIDVHDMFRGELRELRDLLQRVRDGALSAGDARSALNRMAMRQNDWTLGAVCARYCNSVTHHHHLEDDGIFPHLRHSDAGLAEVLDRLGEEHLAIHDAIEGVDRALVHHMQEPSEFGGLQSAVDLLTDVLLSHFSYEERELVEPLARFGFYEGQIPPPPSA